MPNLSIEVRTDIVMLTYNIYTYDTMIHVFIYICVQSRMDVRLA